MGECEQNVRHFVYSNCESERNDSGSSPISLEWMYVIASQTKHADMISVVCISFMETDVHQLWCVSNFMT